MSKSSAATRVSACYQHVVAAISRNFLTSLAKRRFALCEGILQSQVEPPILKLGSFGMIDRTAGCKQKAQNGKKKVEKECCVHINIKKYKYTLKNRARAVDKTKK